LRQTILEIAREEFKRRGVAQATVEEIARKAKVTETQVYRYFGSKTELFRESIFNPLDQHLLKFLIREMSAESRKQTFYEAVLRDHRGLQRFIAEHSDLIAALVFAEKYSERRTEGIRAINSLEAYLTHAAEQQAKLTPGRPRIDTNLMVRASFAAVLGTVLFKDWVFPQGADDRAWEKAVSTILVDGMGNTPGPRSPTRTKR
jgi:AcrR family transcriptional regulator